MKKILLVIMVAVIAAASVLALTACSGPAGVYKFESVTVKGWNYETTFQVGDAQSNGGGSFSEDSMILTLNKDGTYELEADSSVLNTKTSGTWEKAKDEDGNKIIQFDNKNFSADYTKDGLTFRYDDIGLILYTFTMKKA